MCVKQISRHKQLPRSECKLHSFNREVRSRSDVPISLQDLQDEESLVATDGTLEKRTVMRGRSLFDVGVVLLE
jgi:hypothetical protein